MTETQIILLFVSIMVLFIGEIIIFFVISSKNTKISSEELTNKIAVYMTNETGNNKEYLSRSLSEYKESISNLINDFKYDLLKMFNESIDKLNDKVDLKLNDSFEKTNKTFETLLERITRIDEAQKNLNELSTNIVSLQDILSDKKARGTFGEIQLNQLLSSIFGENNKKMFDLQHKLSNGCITDAILFTPEPMGHICIDSKFPLENYQKLIDTKKPEYEQLFKIDVKKHIDTIKEKYILLGETGQEAIMFIPAEAIFAYINAYLPEMVIYAQNAKVWITSPTTLMASLTTIQILIRNIERDKHSKIIQEELNKLSLEFSRYKERWDRLKKNIESVSKNVNEIHITSEKIGSRFDSISKVEFDSKLDELE